MKKTSTLGPARVRRHGEIYLRCTVQFRRRRSANQDRAVVQDALVRAHGFRTIAGLTGHLASALGRFRCYIGRSALAALVRRPKDLVKEGCISLWVGGKRVVA